MQKLSTFLIIVVLILRGLIYIYDNNKTKIDGMVQSAGSTSSETTSSTNNSSSTKEAAADVTISPIALTFLLAENNEIYYYVGEFNGSLYKIDRDYVGVFIKAYKNASNPDDLMFVIKSDKNVPFKTVVDFLDEMEKNEVPAGHYKEMEMTKDETDKLKLITTTKNG
jgi:biopolymer transport protein ExbD